MADTVITILCKDDEEPKDAELNANLDEVPVVNRNAYVELSHACPNDDLEGSRLYNKRNGTLALELECGDEYVFDTEKLLACIIRATQL